jgi:hypothetical protein
MPSEDDLDVIDREYGRDEAPCPFCGGFGPGRGHDTLRRSDGTVVRCQAGDVRELARRLRIEKARSARFELLAGTDDQEQKWGIYVVTGPSADTWCQHVQGQRIETDERTAKTIALLFTERFQHVFKYEARLLIAK